MKKSVGKKLEKQKAEKLRAEEAAINISQPDFSETEEITPAVKKRKNPDHLFCMIYSMLQNGSLQFRL